MFSSKISKTMSKSLIDIDGLKPLRNMITTEYLADDMHVLYRAGLYNQFYPMPIAEDDYAIDIDCYTKSGVNTYTEIINFLNKAHSIIQALFEDSINDKMRETMGIINE